MSKFRRFEIVQRSPSYSIEETSILKTLMLNPFYPSLPILEDELDCALESLRLASSPPTLFDEFDALTDLFRILDNPFQAPIHRLIRTVGLGIAPELYFQSLRERASDLGLHRLTNVKIGGRKYTWKAEINSPEKIGVDWKYKVRTDIKGGNDEKKGFEWTAEIKGKGGYSLPFQRTCSIKVSSGDVDSESEKYKEKKKSVKVKGKSKSVGSTARVVEIEVPSHHGAVVLRQVFAKSVEKSRGKRRVLSPQNAAALIQIVFRAYLIRRSQALRALRELAISKTKLKEIRASFNNFAYRRRLAHDAEERQRFSEKIIVLLLTVDSIEGADLMVRAAKKSMLDELEAILDFVEPQPPGKSLAIRRKTFDMPYGIINKELAAGVAQVVQMLDQEASGSETFEACL